jgi:hypothetical protein
MKRAIRSLCLVRGVMGLALQAPALADSERFWGAKTPVPKPYPRKISNGSILSTLRTPM